MIRLLQLSDIHLLYKDEEMDAYSDIRQGLFSDIKDFCASGQQINHILICGDIANSGEVSQYEKAKCFIDKLCEIIGCNPFEVYIIPGNHDKKRDVEYATTRKIIYNSLRDNNKNDELLEIFKYKETQTLKLLYKPLMNYYQFADYYDCTDHLARKCINGVDGFTCEEVDKMYWKQSLAEISGFKINLFGINSVLTSDENDEKNKQFLPKFTYRITKETNHINMMMMHHPINDIISHDKIEKELDERFDIQLYGHIHKQSSATGKSIKIFSGSLQPPESDDDQYLPVYNIIDIDIENMTDLKLTLHARKWNGECFIDFTEESKTLKLNIQHDNPWENKSKEDLKENNLPQGVKIREIQYAFLSHRNPRSIINRLYNNSYNDDLTLHVNCIKFLQKIKNENRFTDLWELLSKGPRIMSYLLFNFLL
jgi:DNA repair exonuclease SbcCD nuclease subunit